MIQFMIYERETGEPINRSVYADDEISAIDEMESRGFSSAKYYVEEV